MKIVRVDADVDVEFDCVSQMSPSQRAKMLTAWSRLNDAVRTMIATTDRDEYRKARTAGEEALPVFDKFVTELGRKIDARLTPKPEVKP